MVEAWERWHREELAILKEHYSKTHKDKLLKLLPGRSWRAIGHAAEKRKIYHPHYGFIRSKEYLAELHTTLSIARQNRTLGYAPFTGKHHSTAAKLAISVSNLRTRGYAIACIARRNGVTEKEVRDIIEEILVTYGVVIESELEALKDVVDDSSAMVG